MSKLIEVYNYWIDKNLTRERKHGRMRGEPLHIVKVVLHLWETSCDILKTLTIVRYRNYERMRDNSYSRSIRFSGGVDTVEKHDISFIWHRPDKMDYTLRGLIDTFLETPQDMICLGLIAERLEECNYIHLSHILMDWYNHSQIRIKRPLVKDHKLALYIPVNPI